MRKALSSIEYHIRPKKLLRKSPEERNRKREYFASNSTEIKYFLADAPKENILSDPLVSDYNLMRI